jgi:hypothetical protein
MDTATTIEADGRKTAAEVESQWDWYRNWLENGVVPAVDADTIHAGFFYRKASRDGGRIPVAVFWKDDGAFVCRVGTRDDHQAFAINDAMKSWTYFAGNLVSRDDYIAAYTKGEWPDGTPTAALAKAKERRADAIATKIAAASAESAAATSDGQPRANIPLDPYEAIVAELADVLDRARDLIKANPKISDETTSNRATNLHRDISDVVKRATKMFETEKAPHWEKCKEIDKKYSFRKDAESIGTTLRKLYETFMIAEKARLQREADERAAAARRELEAKQAAHAKAVAEAEAAAAKKMADDPIAAMTEPSPVDELPPPPPPPTSIVPEQVVVRSGGGVGRAAGLKDHWIGKITDIDALFAHFRDAPDVRDALQKLVDGQIRVTKGSTVIPGVEIIKTSKVA